MANDVHFEAEINPLLFHEVDTINGAIEISNPCSCSCAFLKYLCEPGVDAEPSALIERYKAVAGAARRLFIAPYEEHILTRLVWPLRHAIACYMLGNYLGTISLCGVVAEMVAILFFDIADVRINNAPMDNIVQNQVWGRTFEKLGQDRRVSVLRAYGLIDDDLKRQFDSIRTKRSSYLHLFSKEHTRLQRDAEEVINATVEILVRVLGISITDARHVALNPMLVRYLERKGQLHPVEAQASENGDSGDEEDSE